MMLSARLTTTLVGYWGILAFSWGPLARNACSHGLPAEITLSALLVEVISYNSNTTFRINVN